MVARRNSDGIKISKVNLLKKIKSNKRVLYFVVLSFLIRIFNETRGPLLCEN
jgi:ribosomal protein L39E